MIGLGVGLLRPRGLGSVVGLWVVSMDTKLPNTNTNVGSQDDLHRKLGTVWPEVDAQAG